MLNINNQNEVQSQMTEFECFNYPVFAFMFLEIPHEHIY